MKPTTSLESGGKRGATPPGQWWPRAFAAPKVSRRQMLGALVTSLPAVFVSPGFAADAGPRKRLGIGMHSYGFQWKAAKDKQPGTKFSDALEFLQYAKRIGAGGVQVTIGAKDS